MRGRLRLDRQNRRLRLVRHVHLGGEATAPGPDEPRRRPDGEPPRWGAAGLGRTGRAGGRRRRGGRLGRLQRLRRFFGRTRDGGPAERRDRRRHRPADERRRRANGLRRLGGPARPRGAAAAAGAWGCAATGAGCRWGWDWGAAGAGAAAGRARAARAFGGGDRRGRRRQDLRRGRRSLRRGRDGDRLGAPPRRRSGPRRGKPVLARGRRGAVDLRFEQDVVRAADHHQVLDIVPPDENELPLSVKAESVDQTEPGLPRPASGHPQTMGEDDAIDDRQRHQSGDSASRQHGDL